jgi:hypothetical protein
MASKGNTGFRKQIVVTWQCLSNGCTGALL